MRQNFIRLFVGLLCWISVLAGSSGVLWGQINTFPYVNEFESEEDLQGWEQQGRVTVADGGVSLSGLSCFIVSPELELSSLTKPVLVIDCGRKGLASDLIVHFSKDGITYPESQKITEGLCNRVILSSDLKKIKIESRSSIIYKLVIKEEVIVNTFPYECVFDEEKLVLPSGGSWMTPVFDMSSLQQPVLTVEGCLSGLSIQTTTDGTNYDVLYQQTDYQSNIMESFVKLQLPDNIEGLKLIMRGSTRSELYRITIDEEEEQVLRDFPFRMGLNMNEELCDWQSAVVVMNSVTMEGGLQSCTSPELDLSTLKSPALTCKHNANSLYVYVSYDGITFEPTALLNQSKVTGFGRYLLPKETKRLKVLSGKTSCVSSLDIGENTLFAYEYSQIVNSNSSFQWEGLDDGSFILKESSNPGGNNSAKLNLYFRTSGEFIYKIRHIDGTEEFKSITPSSGNPALVTFLSTDFRENDTVIPVAMLGSVHVGYVPELYYDIDGDGVKEVFYGGTIYKYAGEFVVDSYIPVAVSKLLNLNNDILPEYSTVYMDEVSPEHYVEFDKIYWYGDSQPLFDKVPVRQLDLNSDGLPDLVAIDGKRMFIWQQHPDHTFYQIKMDTVSLNAPVDSAVYQKWEYVGQTSGMNVNVSLSDSWAQMMNGYAKGTPSTMRGDLKEVDFNKDGLPDLVDTDGGTLFLNKGNNRFTSVPLKGKLVTKDLNGDFVTDYILYDEKTKTVTTLIYDGGGKYKEQTLIRNMSISNIHCYDLDKDSDVDILLTFDYSATSGWTFLVTCENDGKGNFTIHEQAYEKAYQFGDCVDADNDGYYDLLAVEASENNVHLYDKIGLFKGKGLSFNEPEAPLLYAEEGFSLLRSHILDINGDGLLELLAFNDDSYARGTIIPLSQYEDFSPNEKPRTMEAPVIIADEVNGKLKIVWKQGQDKETSAIDLTYALRVGSAPGQVDIYYAHANEDGTRRRFGEGNMGVNLDKTLDVNGWRPGNYYISVQTVDAGGGGSAWSSETVYTHKMLSSLFYLSTDEVASADTLTVALAGYTVEGWNYQWDLADGKIIDANSDRSILKVQFPTGGEKKISLQVTDGNGNSSLTTEKEVYVYGNTFMELEMDSKVEPFSLTDIDGDGILDGVGDYGFVLNDGKGNYKKLPAIFNSDLTFQSSWGYGYLDYDMDGDFDIYAHSNKGNYAINEGNKSFSFLTKENNVEFRLNTYYADLNNDGFLEGESKSQVYKNSGDNIHFEELQIEKLEKDFHFNTDVPPFVDFNRDGYVDMYDYYSPDYNSKMRIWINKGKFDFDIRQINVLDEEDVYSRKIKSVVNMNNDGYEDLILVPNTRKLRIILGNKDMDYSKNAKDIDLPYGYTMKDVLFVRDMDNNGYLDVVLDLGDKGGAILYFFEDLSCKLIVDPNQPVMSDHFFVDINGDGTPELGEYWFYANQSKITNQAPLAPANVRSAQTERGILLQWDDAKDAETPAVQMRYNISVKKKGATGEGAFIISPMNGLKDEAAIIPEAYYQKATRKEIPIERFEVGQEYEVQVQSIDLWNAHSPMSEVYTFTVENQVAVLAPEETCLNAITSVSYCGTEDVSGGIAWNWDGGIVVSGTGSGPYEVTWSAPGVKMVTVSVAGLTSTKAIKVNEGLDLAFNLPAAGLAGCEVNFLLPGLFKDASKTTEIRQSDDAVKIVRRTGSLEAKAMFPEEGRYWIELSTTDDICGEISNRKYIDIKGTAPTPVIKLVGIDGETGKNKVMWDMPDMPQYVTNVNVYREGSKYNDFELIGSVLPSEGMYIDYTSNPRITASRYRIALDTEYNAESNPSRIHGSTHLMLNKGMGNAVNLVWNQYEGGIVESYRILRGTSKDNLSVLAEVSGANNAYSDLSAGEAVYYYALEYDNTYSDEWKPMGVSARKVNAVADASGRSNVVCTDEAWEVTLATSLNVLALESEMMLTPEQTAIHFYTEIFPVMADYKKVNWQIVQGNELATINQNGLLNFSGMENGTIVVRATTIDGSDISKEVTVRKKDFTTWASSIEITSQEGDYLLTPEQSQLHLQAAVLPASASQQVEWSIIEGTALATISQDGTVKAKGTDNGAITVCATALDGSGIYEEVVIMKSRFLPSGIDSNRDESVRCRYEKGKVYVEGLPAIGANLLLTDINGRILQEQNTNDDSFTLDVDTYIRGVYLLRIDTGKGRMTFRFVR